MESESHVRRLEYNYQLDANDCSQWDSGHGNIRSFEYDQYLDFERHRGQWHHLHLSRHESLYRHRQSRIDTHHQWRGHQEQFGDRAEIRSCR